MCEGKGYLEVRFILTLKIDKNFQIFLKLFKTNELKNHLLLEIYYLKNPSYKKIEIITRTI